MFSSNLTTMDSFQPAGFLSDSVITALLVRPICSEANGYLVLSQGTYEVMGVQGAKPPCRGLGCPQIFLFPKMLVDSALCIREVCSWWK